ncbi:MAG: hypothetical protein WBX16_06225 [Candidatus Acidiferrales bacterium]
MPGIDFDRQIFIPPVDQPEKPPSQIIGVVILVVAILGIGFVGYKLMSDTSLNGASAEANSLQQIQQELADMNKRIDLLEKKHKAALESTVVTPKPEPAASSPTTRSKPAYQISAASALSPQRNPSPTSQTPAPRTTPVVAANDTADRESWQATTDRLADVVGAVGSQEGEINQTRDELNQLLAQTRRSALQFELTRGTGRQSVGPVELLLKGSDPKSQRYTVCVYVSNKCVELKDRVLDEVVVFVLARGTPPLELVATRISRDEIVGYLEVPTEKVIR